MFLKKQNSQKGFTLIEVMISIIIVGVVLGTGFTTYNAVQRRSRDVKRQSDLAQIKSALQQYYADNHYYPSSINFSSVTDLTNCTGAAGGCTLNKTYLESIPKDPNSSKNYCYSAQLGQNNNTSACTNAEGSKCLFYSLCAKLENPKTAMTDNCGCGGNYFVTPKSSDSSN